jgi:hypothetical protein
MMKVFGRATDKEELWTAPYPEQRFGFKARYLGGDMLSPILKGGVRRPGREAEKRNWFNTIPAGCVRRWRRSPGYFFLSVRAGRFGFYVGHKVFGVDASEYYDFPLVRSDEVRVGSRAVSGFTWRFTSSLRSVSSG